MAATYSNKFIVEIGSDGTSRIIFQDERNPLPGLEGIKVVDRRLAAEIVMTRENLRQLSALIEQLLEASA